MLGDHDPSQDNERAMPCDRSVARFKEGKSMLTLDIETVGMGVVWRFRDTNTPRAVLGVHADRTAPGRRRKVGIKRLHRGMINKWGLFG